MPGSHVNSLPNGLFWQKGVQKICLIIFVQPASPSCRCQCFAVKASARGPRGGGDPGQHAFPNQPPLGNGETVPSGIHKETSQPCSNRHGPKQINRCFQRFLLPFLTPAEPRANGFISNKDISVLKGLAQKGRGVAEEVLM